MLVVVVEHRHILVELVDRHNLMLLVVDRTLVLVVDHMVVMLERRHILVEVERRMVAADLVALVDILLALVLVGRRMLQVVRMLQVDHMPLVVDLSFDTRPELHSSVK